VINVGANFDVGVGLELGVAFSLHGSDFYNDFSEVFDKGFLHFEGPGSIKASLAPCPYPPYRIENDDRETKKEKEKRTNTE
jgi:hypothetical protein